MDRHRYGYYLSFLSLSAGLLILFHHIDALDDNLVFLGKNSNHLSGLAFVLSCEHDYIVIFLDGHDSKILYDFRSAGSDGLKTFFRKFSRNRTEDAAGNWFLLSF